MRPATLPPTGLEVSCQITSPKRLSHALSPLARAEVPLRFLLPAPNRTAANMKQCGHDRCWLVAGSATVSRAFFLGATV